MMNASTFPSSLNDAREALMLHLVVGDPTPFPRWSEIKEEEIVRSIDTTSGDNTTLTALHTVMRQSLHHRLLDVWAPLWDHLRATKHFSDPQTLVYEKMMCGAQLEKLCQDPPQELATPEHLERVKQLVECVEASHKKAKQGRPLHEMYPNLFGFLKTMELREDLINTVGDKPLRKRKIL